MIIRAQIINVAQDKFKLVDLAEELDEELIKEPRDTWK